MGRGGIVSALLVAIAAIALAPAFSEAASNFNSSVTEYGQFTAIALEQLSLLAAVIAVVFIAARVVRAL